MENTLENKKRFFALYYGQIVANVTKGSCTHPEGTIHVMDENVLRSCTSFVKHKYSIELKSISNIDGQDAKDWASSLGFNDMNDFKSYINKIHPNGEGLEQVDLDFLRSKGYAAPFNDLTIKDQIQYGWIKLS